MIVAIFCVITLISVSLWIAAVTVLTNPPNGGKCFSFADSKSELPVYVLREKRGETNANTCIFSTSMASLLPSNL